MILNTVRIRMIIDTIILVRCVPSTIHDQQTITVLETIGKVIKMDQENNLLEGRSIQTLDMMRLFILYQRLFDRRISCFKSVTVTYRQNPLTNAHPP